MKVDMLSIELPASLSDNPELDAHNEALRAHQAELNWSKVESAEPAALKRLLAGLDLDEHADELGIDSLPDSLVGAVMAVLEPPLQQDDKVQHPEKGVGQVRANLGDTVLVRFEDGVEELPVGTLKRVADRAEELTVAPAVDVVTKALGFAILSVNDAWGVFSRSRIALLPHQLWVCNRVLQSWPTRWLVADDVGLGKTIEAGLILTPLLSSGRVKRLLILAPAGLVPQWQQRLREMFDIRTMIYAAGSDTPTSDYWNTQSMVVASAQTLRRDSKGRWDRLLDAEPWDMVLVDEAHHLNVDETRGPTLSFELASELQKRGKIQSMVLFTGTPHRGKDHGFKALLHLLRPDLFSLDAPLDYGRLREVMIRNNKSKVTDMEGRPLFTPVTSRSETYSYSHEEESFYEQLTEFITAGRAYASKMKSHQQQRTVMLVLIAMQKLASSSVAAIRSALANRLVRLEQAKERLGDANLKLSQLAARDDLDEDERARLEEQIVEEAGDLVQLNPDEIPAIRELLGAADAVTRETRIERILDLVDGDFADRSVLFFTEYKKTQAALMGALHRRFGDGCVAFINGDGELPDVPAADGTRRRMRSTREDAAACFNAGKVRFLVSTEAAGEGIDLQESCHTLIHVDLPWNPMRLHQRVGRLSRYGQEHPVDVVVLRNPDTVESRIWECIDAKLERITQAFHGAMDDPEDMRQLVIGMASTGLFSEVFSEADPTAGREQLNRWFDAKTATFGGNDAVSVVKDMFGNVARFDFGKVAGSIPRVDLPDLVPFFRVALTRLGRRPISEGSTHLEFKTPNEWVKNDFVIQDRYTLLFDRDARVKDGDVAGVGLRVVDRALDEATRITAELSALGGLTRPLVVFAIRDRVTGVEGGVRRQVLAMALDRAAGWTLLRDWELLRELGAFAAKPRGAALSAPPASGLDPGRLRVEAQAAIDGRLRSLDLPFQIPYAEPIAILVPGQVASSRSVEGEAKS